MSEQGEKKQTVEWSFSFENITEKIGNQLKKMGIGDDELKTVEYAEPVGSATAVEVELGMAVGRVSVRAVTNPDNLFEAKLTYTGELEYSVTGDAEKKIRLAQKKPSGPLTVTISDSIRDVVNKFVNNQDLRWDIGIGTKVPVKLEIDDGVGESVLDLTGVPLTKLELDSGVGETRLTLPAVGRTYDVDVESGVGATQISIAAGASLRLKLEGGVGGTAVQLPPGAAVRLNSSGGLGGVSVPAAMKRVKGSEGGISPSGVWETEGFALSAQQITIEYEGGIGGLKIS